MGVSGCGGGGSSCNNSDPGSTAGTLAIVNTKAGDEANISIIDYASGETFNDLLPAAMKVTGNIDISDIREDIRQLSRSTLMEKIVGEKCMCAPKHPLGR